MLKTWNVLFILIFVFSGLFRQATSEELSLMNSPENYDSGRILNIGITDPDGNPSEEDKKHQKPGAHLRLVFTAGQSKNTGINLLEYLPEGTVVPLFVSESNFQQALDFYKKLKDKDISFEIIPVSDKLIKKFRKHRIEIEGPDTDTKKRRSKKDIAAGICTTLFRGASTSFVWFNIDGLDPTIAITLTVIQTFLSGLQQVKIDWFDEKFEKVFLFGRKIKDKVSKKTEFARRQFWDLSQGILWRTLSGPVGDAHSITELIGVIEVVSNSLISGGGGSIFSTQRNRRITRKASRWINLDMFMLGSMLGLLDLAGHHFWQINMGFFTASASKLAMISAFAAGTGGMILKPKLFERFGMLQDRLMGKVINNIEKPVKRVWNKISGCKNYFRNLSNKKTLSSPNFYAPATSNVPYLKVIK